MFCVLLLWPFRRGQRPRWYNNNINIIIGILRSVHVCDTRAAAREITAAETVDRNAFCGYRL